MWKSIMVDLETLGKGYRPPILQIAACLFDVETGEIFDTFDHTADIRSLKNIEGDTLSWWLETDKELLANLVARGHSVADGGFPEKELIEMFANWVKGQANGCPIYFWGNGILFDNRIIKEKCEQYNLQYPIPYNCDVDMRTIIELAARKTGFESQKDYRNQFLRSGLEHDAMSDVLHQVKCVCQAYQDLMQ